MEGNFWGEHYTREITVFGLTHMQGLTQLHRKAYHHL